MISINISYLGTPSPSSTINQLKINEINILEII